MIYWLFYNVGLMEVVGKVEIWIKLKAISTVLKLFTSQMSTATI